MLLPVLFRKLEGINTLKGSNKNKDQEGNARCNVCLRRARIFYWLVMLSFQGKFKRIKQHAVKSSLLIEKAEVTREIQIKIMKKNN